MSTPELPGQPPEYASPTRSIPGLCRCPGCLASIPPAVGAPAAEVAAHADHLRKLAAIGSLPDPTFYPHPSSDASTRV